MDLHPLIIHFPIVCLLLALIFDVVGHFARVEYLHKSGFALLIGGALLTIPSAYTGESAAENARHIPGIIELLHHHQDLSTIALWSSLILVVTRIHLVARKRYVGGRKFGHMIATAACVSLIMWSAYIGGQLVYEFGAGTAGQKQQAGGDDRVLERDRDWSGSGD
jgi:uncharacterized membrane protein